MFSCHPDRCVIMRSPSIKTAFILQKLGRTGPSRTQHCQSTPSLHEFKCPASDAVLQCRLSDFTICNRCRGSRWRDGSDRIWARYVACGVSQVCFQKVPPVGFGGNKMPCRNVVSRKSLEPYPEEYETVPRLGGGAVEAHLRHALPLARG